MALAGWRTKNAETRTIQIMFCCEADSPGGLSIYTVVSRSIFAIYRIATSISRKRTMTLSTAIHSLHSVWWLPSVKESWHKLPGPHEKVRETRLSSSVSEPLLSTPQSMNSSWVVCGWEGLPRFYPSAKVPDQISIQGNFVAIYIAVNCKPLKSPWLRQEGRIW